MRANDLISNYSIIWDSEKGRVVTHWRVLGGGENPYTGAPPTTGRRDPSQSTPGLFEDHLFPGSSTGTLLLLLVNQISTYCAMASQDQWQSVEVDIDLP